MVKSPISIMVILLAMFLVSCSLSPEKRTTHKKEPLASWNEGKNKTDIIHYIETVTNESNVEFIPVENRIAVFDNDGTMWSEQPLYFQLVFVVDRVKEMAKDHPEWEEEEPFKSILETGIKGLVESGHDGIGKALLTTHTGITVNQFHQFVKTWADTAMNPVKKVHYTNLVFQPMLELLDYLRANDFKIYIVSGGSVEFMRPIISDIYNIPYEQIIGTSFKAEYEYQKGNPFIQRLPELEFNNDKEGKPVNIQKIIGKKPVFCGGNSDGDLAMMQWTASSTYESFKLYIHHTDSVREWAYDRNSGIGKLDKGLDQAITDGWNVVNMKNDWRYIFPFELLQIKNN